MSQQQTRHVSIVLFDDFELLDVFGPLELLSRLPDLVHVHLVGPTKGPVRSSQGAEVLTSARYTEALAPDIVLVPGGKGTRALAEDADFLAWLTRWSQDAERITSVCTGSALLAAAGLLDGYRATSNKRAFAWAVAQSPRVDWAPAARWVHDRDRWTSSGVAAGMDMTAALIADLFGPAHAERAANEIEWEARTDPDHDPFAIS